MTENAFHFIFDMHRNPDIWYRHDKCESFIKDFCGYTADDIKDTALQS